MSEYSHKHPQIRKDQSVIIVDEEIHNFNNMQEASHPRMMNKTFKQFSLKVKKIDYHKRHKKVLTRSFVDLLDNEFCPFLKRNINRAEFVQKEIDNYLDIIKYVTQQNEIETMKKFDYHKIKTI
jgi:hypothetical protein